MERSKRARAAVQLKSEHIAKVHGIGRLPTGEPHIVMDLLDGSDFEGLLRRDRWLPVEDAADYVLQACEAVSEAHVLGVVHRDLEPKELFLSHRLDGTPVVKVLDFGISTWTLQDSDSHRSRAPATCSGRRTTCRPSRSAARATSTGAPTFNGQVFKLAKP